jgi:translation initiation factor IF-3
MDALRLAGEADVDLVEISPAIPPVCRLMDYGNSSMPSRRRRLTAKSSKSDRDQEIKFGFID